MNTEAIAGATVHTPVTRSGRWDWASSAWAPWAVLAVSFAIVMGFLSLLPARYAVSEATDFQFFYDPVARRMLSGEGLVTPSGVAARYPPGYPAILAGVYGFANLIGVSDASLMRPLSALFTAAASALLFAFGRAAFGPVAGLVAAALWTAYPNALWMSKQPGSEGPFAPLLVAVFWLLWNVLRQSRLRWPAAFAAGAGFGALMLIRPIAIGLPLLGVAAIWLLAADRDRVRRVLAAVVVCAGAMLTVLPWETFVHGQTGQWIPLSTGGAATMRDGLTFAVRLKGFRTGTTVPGDVRELMQDLSARYEELDSAGKIASVLAGEAAKRPAAVAKLMLIKAMRSWYGTDSQRFETPLLAMQAVYLAGLGLALFVAFRRQGPIRTLGWLLAGIVVYFWAMTAISLPLVRYMTPMMTMSFLGMGAAFAVWKSCPGDKVRVL